MFPLVLEVRDRLAVVVGGGRVGRRKAEALLAAGARVRLVCREPRPSEERSAALDWITADYVAMQLTGAALVFAAAPVEINARVVADARARGIWVNDAADPSAGDFHLPAVVRRGDFLLAVSTGAAAPALARAVKERLELEYDDAFAAWVALLGELRDLVQARVSDSERRRALLEEFSRWEWLDRLRRDGVDRVREGMLAAAQ
jgi:precorrin-2 dehydrogenase/sirohydrochlorin ferrochelatase